MKRIPDIFKINFISIYLNLKYFPLKQALRFPIIVYGRVCIHSLSGNITIGSPIRTGMIKIGKNALGIIDNKVRTIINLQGDILFNGSANIGKGCSFSVGRGSKIEFGDKFISTGNCTFIASDKKKIIIGRGCLLSWDIIIMNTDFHNIIDTSTHSRINMSKDVVIGDSVWIGCRNTILKGAVIPQNTVIGANSLITAPLRTTNSIYAGIPAKIIKKDIYWEK